MILLAVVCAVSGAYQLVSILAAAAHLRRRPRQNPDTTPPGVSILKPVYGADPHFLQAIRSHAQLSYPAPFEILFGVSRPDDPAIPLIEQLQREFPERNIRLIQCASDAPNAKVGTLELLGNEAGYPVWIVNDSDITVPPDYLTRLTTRLAEPGAGLVTCLYRAAGDSFAARWEALGIATDFAPSALVAPFVGVNEFGLGSTLAFRREDFERTGGFVALREYIADDYQLGKRISALDLRVVISEMAVATHLGRQTWRDIWRHQLRWARTIRVSRGGYFGLPVTHASVWAAVALAAGRPLWACALLSLRLAGGLTTGILVLRDPVTARYWWLMPLRDLWGAAVWAAGAFGTTVLWRGKRIRLHSSGRIVLE